MNALASPDAALKDFCQTPYQMVCGEGSAVARERMEHIQQIADEIKKPALAAAYEYLYDGDEMPPDFDENILKNIMPKAKRQKATKLFLAELRVQLRRYLEANNVPTDMEVPAIKGSLIRAIQNSNEIDGQTRDAMITSVQETRVMTIADINSEVLENSGHSVIEVYKGCSKNMFLDNAFATEISHQKVVVICPGEIIGSIEFAKAENLSVQARLGVLIMTLGHEISHHFDYRTYPQAYQNLMANLGTSSNYMSEISADAWGLKTFMVATNAIANTTTRATLLRGGMNDLCGTADDGEHPDGRFRIEKLAPVYLCK